MDRLEVLDRNAVRPDHFLPPPPPDPLGSGLLSATRVLRDRVGRYGCRDGSERAKQEADSSWRRASVSGCMISAVA